MHREYLLFETIDADRQRDALHRSRARAIREGGSRRPARATLWARVRARLRPDHSLTDYPCRLPDGSIGRVAAVLVDGEWTLVCRMA
jgi:hypothetical protein